MLELRKNNHTFENTSNASHAKKERSLDYDVVVVGGGYSGVSAAIAAARHGARTAIIQNRSVFGGNGSSEVKMHVMGAGCHWGKRNACETGIISELMLENKRINDNYDFSVWDHVTWWKVKNTKNLDMFLNTSMDEVIAEGDEVKAIRAYQMTTEITYTFTARIFIDCTGHGTLGYYAGAEYRMGTESKYEFDEPDAPEEANGDTMGNTIMFCANDTGHPVKFVRPEWAYSFDEDDLKYRPHGDVSVYHTADDVVTLPRGFDYTETKELVEKYDVYSGYWWIELGGDWDNIITDAEDIRDELLKCVYGVWDHIKNHGDHGAENYELTWVGSLPGMRESRRLVGDYILTQHDIYGNNEREDGVAYGGWPMDEHTVGGLHAKGKIPSRVISYDGLFNIPYGCYYSKNIKNLMMAGRNISASKLAMGSVRVMATCAVGGQAVGTAAAIAIREGITPREVGVSHLDELRQTLLRDDCYILGCKNHDPLDLARKAEVTATSEAEGCACGNVINGVTRTVGDNSNMWRSRGIADGGESLTLSLPASETISQIRLTFDPDLSEEKCISISHAFITKQAVGVPRDLVRDFDVEMIKEGATVGRIEARENAKRQVILDLDSPVCADSVRITVLATNGFPDAKIFEVRIY